MDQLTKPLCVASLSGRPPRASQRGFTLIELMVVVLVLSILAGLAFASYQNSVVESRRRVAAGCLLEASQFMERFYTTNLTYAGAALPALACRNDLAPFYTIEINGTPTATAFAVRAVPVGQQLARDGAKCGTLGLTQTGAKSATGTNGVACW